MSAKEYKDLLIALFRIDALVLLHYSAQTVYNYRLKVRSKSFLSKEDFLNMVQKIG